ATQHRLERWRFEPTAVERVDQARAAIADLAARGDRLGAVILDLKLPSGAMIDEVRPLRDLIGPDLPLIVLSQIDASDYASQDPNTSYLSKPVSASLLLTSLQELLSGAPTGALADTGSEPAQSEPVQPGLRSAGPVDVLIVEDTEAVQLVFSLVLEKHHLSYAIAKDGEQALQAFSVHHPRLVFMDVSMPVMDGLTATAKIRQIERNAQLGQTPIIGVTAHALIDDRQRCLDAGMNDYLPKPIVPANIGGMLSLWLTRETSVSSPAEIA
ncbi:MAG: response regulator, partial [Quisquiliibacterium sp.]